MINDNGRSFSVAGGVSARSVPICPRVFVLSDLRLLREGLAALLAQQSAVKVVGMAGLSAEPAEIAERCPHILLLDVSGPGALEVSGPIRLALAGAKVVALGVVEDEETVLACAEASVSGFVAPGGSVADVVAAVQSAVRGECVCSPRTAGLLLSRVAGRVARLSAGLDALTEREREIVMLMDQGRSNKDIARALDIRNATVKNHVHNILGKLQARSRAEAVAQLRRGLRGPAETLAERIPAGRTMDYRQRPGLGQRI